MTSGVAMAEPFKSMGAHPQLVQVLECPVGQQRHAILCGSSRTGLAVEEPLDDCPHGAVAVPLQGVVGGLSRSLSLGFFVAGLVVPLPLLPVRAVTEQVWQCLRFVSCGRCRGHCRPDLRGEGRALSRQRNGLSVSQVIMHYALNNH